MKRNPVIILIVLLTVTVLVTACGAFGDQSNGDSNASGENQADEMVFDEDEVDPVNDDEMDFEDDEGSLVALGKFPPSGTWLWTNSDPTYEGCPVDMSNAVIPPDPPGEVEIEMSDNGDAMYIFTSLGAVELYLTTFSETASAYEAVVVIPVAGGEDLEVEYYLDFNFLEDSTIGGTLITHLPEFVGCVAIRSFTAEYIRP